jgi:hypothetical protein
MIIHVSLLGLDLRIVDGRSIDTHLLVPSSIECSRSGRGCSQGLIVPLPIWTHHRRNRLLDCLSGSLIPFSCGYICGNGGIF